MEENDDLKFSGIYLITNMINGKMYVGQSKNIYNRFKSHKASAFSENVKRHYLLYRSIRKYGLENFRFEVLEECKPELLLEREQYWYNMLKPEYNLMYPRETPSENNKKPILQIDPKTLKVIAKFDSCVGAGKALGLEPKNISAVASGKERMVFGCYWCYVKDYSKDWQPKPNKTLRPVMQINMNLEIVAKFESIRQASEETKICRACINRVALKKGKHAGNYIWRYI